MSHLLEDLKLFLDHSPTSWHAAKEIGNRLAVQDFVPLEEAKRWELEAGGKYFVIRGGSLLAFSLPRQKPTKSILLASHTDSPALKIKPKGEFVKENMVLFGVEVYGGPLLSSWLNRDLAIAGRVIVTNAQGDLEEFLVFIDDAPVFIPQLAIHLDRDVNEKGLLLNKQDHLNAIACLKDDEEKGYLEKLLRRHLSFHSLLSYDLFLVPMEESRYLGRKNEMLASYRLDNLASAHSAACALALSKESKDVLQMGIFWDNEEIGSRTKEGAASSFLGDVLERIGYHLELDKEELILLKNNSLCLSIDMAHALNPNYANKHDANHPIKLGGGIVIKHNADQRYASNALSASSVIQLCQNLNLPYQVFVNRSDMPCGSTVGPIVASQLGINTVDIGCPQLSMHSSREVMAVQDHLDMCHLLTEILQQGKP